MEKAPPHRPGSSACRARSAGGPAETAGSGARPARAALAEAFEALETRLAVSADFAAVELLALVRVADNLIGVVDFGEILFRLRVFVLVGMVVLGELAERLLDLRLARLATDTKDLIGVTHCGCLGAVVHNP